MAGHSKFKNIMHRKGAQDKKRASLFAKLTRELIVSVKMGGSDPSANHRLRLAISSARAHSMPKDNIERAIKRGEGSAGGEDYTEIRYEGYGPSAIAIIVECLSDNRNRTASDLRAIFAKAGGNLGESNSVAFMFDRMGQVEFGLDVADEETFFEAAIEAGGSDVESDEGSHLVFCPPEILHSVTTGLEARFGEPLAAKLVWKPKNLITIDRRDKAEGLLKMLDLLEEHDDVQDLFANFTMTDALLEDLGADSN
ncbi:MAG: YebC/PmpR family DNA-binding transcriptional regulator [Pseudomonadota bacterium]